MQNAVQTRGIHYVFHFTRLSNLDGILRKGLLPRSLLDTRADETAVFNDPYRLDGELDAICCSVGHPNYKMFYRLRCENPGEEWVVIACNPSILWEKECAFCVENAASSNVTCIPLSLRKGLDAFNKIFEPIEGKADRSALGLPDSCPTNPQAEILVYGGIEPKYIAGAVTQSKPRELELKARYPDFDFLYHKSFFSARKDYEHWR